MYVIVKGEGCNNDCDGVFGGHYTHHPVALLRLAQAAWDGASEGMRRDCWGDAGMLGVSVGRRPVGVKDEEVMDFPVSRGKEWDVDEAANWESWDRTCLVKRSPGSGMT